MLPFPHAGSGWGLHAALDAAPDPQDFPAVVSFSCLSKSLILWSCCCTCALNCTASVFRLDICPANNPICSRIPSSRDASAPLIAATVAFASDESCRGAATGVIEEPGACTTAMADVAGPVGLLTQILCTVFLRIHPTSSTLNTRSPAPGILNLPRVLCRFFPCSGRSPCLGPVLQRR